MKELYLVGTYKDCFIVSNAFENYLYTNDFLLKGFFIQQGLCVYDKYEIYKNNHLGKILKRKNSYFTQIGFDYLTISSDRLISLIHPTVLFLDSFSYGLSNVIMPKTIFYQNIEIGNFNVFMNSVKAGHDIVLRNYCFFNYYSFLGSNTKYYDNVKVGLKSTIKENLILAKNSKILDGSTLINNTLENETWQGIPAIKI